MSADRQGRKPSIRHAKDRALVTLPSGVVATLLYVSGKRGRSARVLIGGRHHTVLKDELRLVEVEQ